MSNALSHGCMVPKNSAFPWDCPSTTTKAKAHGRPRALSRCRDRDPTPKPKLLNSCGLRPGHLNWVIPPSRVKRCMRSSSSEVTEGKEALRARPSPAETTRTLMELCSEGTLCTLTQSGWPFGFAVEFAVDVEGTPVLCLDPSSLHSQHAVSHSQCTLHVQLHQNGFKQLQCSVIGSLSKPDDRILKQRLHSIWKRQFVEEANEDYLYTIVIEKVFQSHGFSQNGFWVDPADYKAAIADPLCPQEAKIIKDMNDRYSEDIHRISRIYVDLNVEVDEATLTWIDKLGFDLHLVTRAPQEVLEVRIPFPREVRDEKDARASLTYMAQVAWEVEKHYASRDFEKVKCLQKLKR